MANVYFLQKLPVFLLRNRILSTTVAEHLGGIHLILAAPAAIFFHQNLMVIQDLQERLYG